MGGEIGVIASALATIAVAGLGYLRTRKSRGESQLGILEAVNERLAEELGRERQRIAALEASRDADRRRIWELEDLVADLRRKVEEASAERSILPPDREE